MSAVEGHSRLRLVQDLYRKSQAANWFQTHRRARYEQLVSFSKNWSIRRSRLPVANNSATNFNLCLLVTWLFLTIHRYSGTALTVNKQVGGKTYQQFQRKAAMGRGKKHKTSGSVGTFHFTMIPCVGFPHFFYSETHIYLHTTCSF